MVESRLDFTFDETFHVVKFDSTDFYKMFYSSMPNGKGVDFIADSEERLIFMEVKNCTVRVVDSNTYKRRYFEVRKAG